MNQCAICHCAIPDRATTCARCWCEMEPEGPVPDGAWRWECFGNVGTQAHHNEISEILSQIALNHREYLHLFPREKWRPSQSNGAIIAYAP